MSTIPQATTQHTQNPRLDRRRRAFLAGDHARNTRQISLRAHYLYEILVNRAGKRPFTWATAARLMEDLGCSDSTITRLMGELEQAGLIWRRRRFGRSWLTFISVYKAPDEDDQDNKADQENTDNDEPEQEVTDDKNIDEDQGQQEQPNSLFLASQSVKVEESDPSFVQTLNTMNDQTQDNKNLNTTPLPPPTRTRIARTRKPRGGGGGCHKVALVENETTERLRQEGVMDVGSLNELSDRTLAQIEATIRIVDATRPPGDPRRPGLIVKLLNMQRNWRGPENSQEQRQPAVVQWGLTSKAANHGNDALWNAVQATMQQRLLQHEYESWIKPTSLLEIDDDLVVISVPNVFIRDELRNHYQDQLRTAVQAELGRAITVEIVINSIIFGGK